MTSLLAYDALLLAVALLALAAVLTTAPGPDIAVGELEE